jgi:hypothetical protein
MDGTCAAALDGLDPHGDCPDDGALSCGKNGKCDGMGACQLYGASTVCAVPFCSGEGQVTEATCDGQGHCDSGPVDCAGLYRCAGGACHTSCAGDGDCVSSAFCDAGVCQPRSPPGKNACTAGHACTTGLCVDGYCCDAPCDGQCEACSVPGYEGTSLALDAAHPPEDFGRPSCPMLTSDPCSQTSCDGVDRKQCLGFVSASVTCSPKRCVDGVAVAAMTCDGMGHCAAPKPQDMEACAPFACGADACLKACAVDAECAPDHHCDTDGGMCSPGRCDGDHTAVTGDGRIQDCSPYRCNPDGSCRTSCGTVGDCAAPFACDDTGTCVARPGGAVPGSCRAAPTGATGPGTWAGVALALAGLASLRSRSGRRRPAR